MIIFLNEERAYLSWVTHHRHGFVLDCLHSAKKESFTLHRATCAQVRQAQSTRTHWTTGPHSKACSQQLDELESWASQRMGAAPAECDLCRPRSEQPKSTADDAPHLTKLDREILSCVLEIAAYHLDSEDSAYAVTAGMVADYLEKTVGQLAAAFARLVEDGLIVLMSRAKTTTNVTQRTRVLPSAKALRTLEGYASYSDEELEVEVEKLG